MRSRSILVALAVVFVPIPVLAQFVTVVAPPRRPRPPVVAAARDTTGRPAATTAAAEEQRRQMLDIKAWVDSAAGALAGRPNSAATPAMPGAPATPSSSPDTTARGRRAPAVRPDSTRRRPPATRPTAELVLPPMSGALARPARVVRRRALA
jgi:hypothetical protein